MQTSKTSISRRDFITAVTVAPVAAVQLQAARRRIPLSLELYSLRVDAGKDLPGTLAAIAKMGYEGIELVGAQGGMRDLNPFGRSAKEVRKMLDDVGLKCFSGHHSLPLLQGDQLEKTVEFNQILGNRRLILSSLPAAKTIQTWYDHAKLVNEIAKKLKKHKMRTGFHNHTAELDLLEGKRPWDVFFDNTSKDVTAQMHIAAFPSRGLDPVEYIKRYRGRVTTMHLNDYAPGKRGALLGEGSVDWKGLFNAAETVGGIEVYIVEQEGYPQGMTPRESCERCLQNFRKLHG